MRRLRPSPARRRRGAALYATVLLVSLLVSLLGLAGVQLSMLERERSRSATDLLQARTNARSAVELALSQLAADQDWRTNRTSGVETAAVSLGGEATGTLGFVLSDSDGSLTNADVDLRLLGVGRVGDVVQVLGVQLDAASQPEQLLLQQDSGNSGTATAVAMKPSLRVAQTFRPSLPAEAESWSITRVQLLLEPSGGTNGVLTISVRETLAGGQPATASIDSVTAAESSFAVGNWYEATFPAARDLDPAKTYCIVVVGTTGGGTLANLAVGSSSTGSPTTRYFLDNQTGVWSEDASKDVWIKVWGTYTLESDGIAVVAGSWTWEAIP